MLNGGRYQLVTFTFLARTDSWVSTRCGNMVIRLSWWLGRLKRSSPFIIIIAVVVILLLRGASYSHTAKERKAVSTPAPPAPPTSMEVWVVVDLRLTEVPGTNACTTLVSQFPGWKVLLVGEKPSGPSISQCVYFNETMATVHQDLVDSENETSRLSLAYLYLIKIGANALFVLGPGKFVENKGTPHVFPGIEYQGLTQSSPNRLEHVDISSHFGCNFSHDAMKHTDLSSLFKICTLFTPAVQAPVSIPVARKDHGIPSCDPRAPPIVTQKGTFTTGFSLNGALFMKDAFWALPLWDIKGSSLYHSVAWKIILQKMLWFKGNRLLLWHNEYNEVIADRSPQYSSIFKGLPPLFKAQDCSRADFETCVLEILKDAQDASLLPSNFIWWISKWIAELKLHGLSHGGKGKPIRCKPSSLKLYPVNYSQPVYTHPRRHQHYVPVTNTISSNHLLHKTCRNNHMPSDIVVNLNQPWEQLDDILLIITFNKPHYEAVPYLEALYRPFFPHLIYCGPEMPNKTREPLLTNYTYSFVTYNKSPKGHFPGAFNYECSSLAMQMKYPVEGYFVIADDVLLALYRLVDLRRHLMWFLPRDQFRVGNIATLRECRLGMCDFHPHWRWWEDYQRQILSSLRQLRSDARTSYTSYKCHKQLVEQTGAELRAFGGYSDLYYIPQRLASDFVHLANLFFRENVFLEVTIPSIIKCVDNPDDIQGLPGLTLWDESRDLPHLHFSAGEFRLKTYMHPTKWGYLARGSPEYINFYCKKVVPLMHDPYGRIR